MTPIGISQSEGVSNGVGYDGESIDEAAKPTTRNVEHAQGSLATYCGKAQACGMNAPVAERGSVMTSVPCKT
jgi:hypothetical protein